jgi:transcription initiation factor TFIIIB Brf1 subunit/transcription initiation factor TFIIB
MSDPQVNTDLVNMLSMNNGDLTVDFNPSTYDVFSIMSKFGSDIWDIECKDPLNKKKIKKEETKETNKEERCELCNGTDFYVDMNLGQKICNCGYVIESNIISSEIERINYDDPGSAVRCGVTYNPLLPQSSIGFNTSINPRLDRIQKSISMPYKERSNYKLMKMITNVCTRNNIPKSILKDPHALCVKVSNTKHKTGKNKGKYIITRGSNRYGYVAACLFLMCRKNKKTRATREIADYFNIDEGSVNNGVKLIRTFLKDDYIIKDTGNSNVYDFIQRKCDELRLKNEHTKLALTMAKNIDRLGIASKHQAYSLAAGCIKLRIMIGDIDYVNKGELSTVFTGLTETTIKKTYNELRKYVKIIVSDKITDQVLERINVKKQKRSITPAIEERMKKHGIKTDKYIVEV